MSYTGILPDLFREGQGILVEGTLNQNGVFEAVEVLAKHDENYRRQNLWICRVHQCQSVKAMLCRA